MAGEALKGEFSTGWAWLPGDLLDSILDKLVTLSDYVRFSVVCKPWFSVAKHRCLDTIHRKIPLLLLPPSIPTEEWRVCGVTGNKVCNFKIPLSYNKRTCGSSHGWLFTIEDDIGRLVLINPFSGGTIRLPAIVKKFPEIGSALVDDSLVFKASLTSDPILYPNDYTVVALCGSRNTLAYIKSGDKHWSFVNIPDQHWLWDWVCDFISYKGLIYLVGLSSRVVSFDISGVTTSNFFLPSSSVKVVAPKTLDFRWTYIVESSIGDLLLVQRFLSDFNEGRRISGFRIFKLQFSPTGEEANRVEVKNIGGDALFLGDNYSMAVLACDFPGCRPNSIYYTDDYFHRGDVGVFNIDDCSIERFLHNPLPNSPQRERMPAIWILPTPGGYPS